MSNRLRSGLAMIATVATLVTVVVVAPLAASSVSAAEATTAFTATSPERVLDTRIGLGLPARLGEGATSQLAIAGQAGVPAIATAVVLNLTITATAAPGFVTIWPSGQPQPTASVIN